MKGRILERRELQRGFSKLEWDPESVLLHKLLCTCWVRLQKAGMRTTGNNCPPPPYGPGNTCTQQPDWELGNMVRSAGLERPTLPARLTYAESKGCWDLPP